jgi:hypothetical protein
MYFLFYQQCKYRCLILRERHRLRVFEKRVPRRIFRRKMDEVTGERKKLYNEEIHNFHTSPVIIRQVKSRRMRRQECGTLGRGEKSVQDFGGKD